MYDTNAAILGNTRKLAEFTPIISRASICSVTRIVPISEAMLLPTFPANIKHNIDEENSSRIISRVVNPMAYFGSNGDVIFSFI